MLGIISVIILVVDLLIWLLLIGANKNKSYIEKNQDDIEQMNYLKKFERKK